MKSTGVFLLAAGFLFATWLPAQAAQAEGDSLARAPIDAQARSVLEAMARQFTGAESFSAEIERVWRVTGDGFLLEYTSRFDAAMERPNRFLVRHKSGFPAGSFASNGQALAFSDGEGTPVLMAMDEAYDYGDVRQKLSNGSPESPTTLFFLALTADDPVGVLMQDVTAASLAGNEEVDGQAARHLRFTQDRQTWDLWVAAGERALPLKMTVRLAESPLSSTWASNAGPMVSVWQTRFDNWQFGVDIPDERFEMEGAVALESAPGPAAPHPLYGKEAPDFSLALLDGETVALSEHEGRDVVILDFWATWCGPCRVGMPILAEVAADYQDKNVVLYGVNLMEDAALVREFLDDAGLRLNVLMDKDGEVGTLYGAQAIPQTVIVGKDGMIKKIHVGISPDLETELRAELDGLVKE